MHILARTNVTGSSELSQEQQKLMLGEGSKGTMPDRAAWPWKIFININSCHYLANARAKAGTASNQ